MKAFDKGGDIPENEEERDRVKYRKKIVDEIEATRERRLILRSGRKRRTSWGGWPRR